MDKSTAAHWLSPGGQFQPRYPLLYPDCDKMQPAALSGDREFVPVAENLEEEYKEQALSPIICAGDVLGAVIITTKDGKIHFTDTEKALAVAAADFLGRQMES